MREVWWRCGGGVVEVWGRCGGGVVEKRILLFINIRMGRIWVKT